VIALLASQSRGRTPHSAAVPVAHRIGRHAIAALYLVAIGVVVPLAPVLAQNPVSGPPPTTRPLPPVADSGAVPLGRHNKSDTAVATRPDSIQPRIGRDNVAPVLDVGQSYTYTRDQFYRSGALTLVDLLGRIPGLTTFRSGFLPAPQVTSFGGEFGRVRIFYDGVEIDDLDARNGGVSDLRTIPLWSLERVSITRGATEVRVDIRSWEYDRVTPYTRFDLLTGDLNTSLYRVFYGKRYYNGSGLQVAAEQFGVVNQREGGGGDQLSIFLRYGVGRRWGSIDVTALRTRATRTITERRFFVGQNPLGTAQDLPNSRTTNTLAYLRAILGKQGNGPFLQFVAATQSLREYSSQFTQTDAAAFGFPADTADSTSSAAQYVLTAGYDRGPMRLRLVERYRRRNGAGYNSPSASFDITLPRIGINVFAEHDPYTSVDRSEAGVRVLPLPSVSLAAYVGQRWTAQGQTSQPDSRAARIEAGIRPFGGGPWFSVGVITRDTAVLLPPIVFDSAFRTVSLGRTNGTIAAVRGPLGRNITLETTVTRWGTVGPYIPEYQLHSEIQWATQWLSKFPAGNFSIRLVPMLDYRSAVRFPRATDNLVAKASRDISVLLEIRILRGEITYQRRNSNLVIYDQVPGYLMPRGLNLYGIRWHFFN
jgi:hypothetical protein